MRIIGGVALTDEQYAAGVAARDSGPWSQYRVWAALKDAGVPVRKDGAPYATHAATALWALTTDLGLL